MKKYLILPVVLLIGLMFYACDDTSTEPEGSGKGSIYLTSVPAGAQIWLGSANQNKVTPDSVTNLDAGSFQVTLKLNGFKDTTFSVTVTAGQKTTKNVVLTSSLLTETFGPVRIWETSGTTAAQKSGLDLSAGVAISTSTASEKENADIYYSSDGFLVRSADYAGLTRVTYFKVGSGNNLNDGTDSQAKDNSWGKNMADTEPNYVFLYDNDLHYSKIIITNSHAGGGIGDPSWVEVQWIYNKTAGDIRF